MFIHRRTRSPRQYIRDCSLLSRGDVAHCSTVKKAAQNKVRASQIGRTVNVAGTSGAAPLVKEADENAVEAS